MTTGERIKAVRKEFGMTQGEFGKRISLVASAICLLENNSTTLTERVAKDICREFNVSKEWLINGHGEMFEQQDSKETLVREFADVISKYPPLYETAKMVSKHMGQGDWKIVSDLLSEMEEKR